MKTEEKYNRVFTFSFFDKMEIITIGEFRETENKVRKRLIEDYNLLGFRNMEKFRVGDEVMLHHKTYEGSVVRITRTV